MLVYTGEHLQELVGSVSAWDKRDIFDELMSSIHANNMKFTILFGLRRTGKSTLMKQAILSLPIEDCKYILCSKGETMNSLFKELDDTEQKYIFIDEVTYLERFTKTVSVLADCFAAKGKRIVVAGTDSLGFVFAKKCGELLDRAVYIRTTYISCREWHRLLNLSFLDYLRYGGTLSPEATFYNDEVSTEYLNTSIVNNFTHGIEDFGEGKVPTALYRAYANNELVSMIQMIIDMSNERFLINEDNLGDLEYLTKDFKAHGLGDFMDILYKHRFNTEPIERAYAFIVEDFRKALRVHNQSDRLEDFMNTQVVTELIQYMVSIDMLAPKSKDSSEFYFTQPGLRFSQCKHLIESLENTDVRKQYTEREWNTLVSIYKTIALGRSLEDIVYTDVLRNEGRKSGVDIRKYKRTVSGVDREFDVALSDLSNGTSIVIEVKNSSECVQSQCKNLLSCEFCKLFENELGTEITRKIVIYNGSTTRAFDVDYINAEEFLLSRTLLV